MNVCVYNYEGWDSLFYWVLIFFDDVISYLLILYGVGWRYLWDDLYVVIGDGE